jgi:general secretion pathway protein F
MPLYRYKAVSQSGEMVEGELTGASKAAVVERLHQLGHTPIRAEEIGRAGAMPLLQRRVLGGERVGRREITLFTREMATLLGAGLTLERALEVLGGIADSQTMRRLVNRLLETIRGGTSFADALAGRGDAFPSYYVSMVRAGEAGGAVEVVLARLGDFMERAQALRESVRSALIYPTIVVVLAGAAVAVLLTVVLPQFTPLFEDAGRALPLTTRVVVAVGGAVQAWWWLGLAVALLLVLLIRQQLARPPARMRWHALLLRLPLFGDLIAKAEAARFGRTLGTLLSNGVPMLNALAIVKDTLANAVMAGAIEDIGAHLKEGKGLAGPLAEVRRFPPLAAQLVRVGEETGQLEEMLHKVADIFDHEVRRAVDRMLALLVPGLTLALGGLIAFIIVSILSALFSVYDLPL